MAAMCIPTPAAAFSVGDTEFDAAIFRNRRVTLGHHALDVDDAAGGIDRAGKFHQGPIAGQLEDTAAMFCDLWIEQLAAARLERGECDFFVIVHQTAVTDHIGRKERGQPSFKESFK